MDITLTLNGDGTFTMESVDDKQKLETAAGTFRIGSVDLAGSANATVELDYTQIDGKAAPKDARQRLLYDPKDDLLHDLLTVAFARAEKAPAMKQAIAAQNRDEALHPPRFDMGRWKKAWEIPLKSGPVPDSEVVSTGTQVATTSEDGMTIVDLKGKLVRTIKIGKPTGYLMSGERLGVPFLVPSNVWAPSLDAYDLTGSRLWTYTPASAPGIDSVAPIHLDKRNTGLVIGYNGGGGVDIVGPDGKLMKHIEVDANVWTVCGARLSAQLPEAAVAVNDGALAFSTTGTILARFDPDGGCGQVAAADLNGDGIEEVLTLGDTVSSGLMLSAFDRSGKKLWSTKPKSVGGFVHRAIFTVRAGGKSLVGVANGGGIALLSYGGKAVDYVTVDATGVAVVPQGVSDLLVVRRIHGLACYEYR